MQALKSDAWRSVTSEVERAEITRPGAKLKELKMFSIVGQEQRQNMSSL